ncbi:hypothetical protein EXIGLDRAFT_830196 [Exidia glandulosa HHB12029]|uniref:F-box domain-containing protein n=1 Tax=Exidia glandulosa HHB12029 TaxID=1314781 RepID=A0A165NUC0_EXIGL|nr:hypothetical protein EXIGLDRAFT_830196 [Exidia glandulosa HHB12029]
MSSLLPRTGFSRLPDEILSMVFRFIPHSLDEDPLLSLSLVCHRWQEVVRRDSSLWADIHIDGFKTLERLQQRLDRSGSWPLLVRVDANHRRPSSGVPFPRALDKLQPHSLRLRVLKLTFHQHDVVLPLRLQVPSLNAPNLEVLSLTIAPAVSAAVTIDITAPRLVELRLLGFRPATWASVLSDRLVSINLQQGFVTAGSVLKDVIASCTNLRTLALAAPLVREFHPSDFADLSPLALDYAHLILIDETVMAQILRLSALAISSIRRVSIAYPASAHSNATVHALLEGFGPVHSVTMRELCIEVTNARGFQRDLTTARRRASEVWLFVEDLRKYGAFETAESITLSPINWQNLVLARHLGNDDLHITLLLDPGEFFSYRFKLDQVECNYVSRLTLSCVDPDDHTVIHPEDIDFIRGLLGVRKDNVVLDRVVMAPNKDEEFDRLLEAMEARVAVWTAETLTADSITTPLPNTAAYRCTLPVCGDIIKCDLFRDYLD